MTSSTTTKNTAFFALMCVSTYAFAQQQPATTEADANAPSERAKRLGDNPYKWIMIMDDKPRPKKDEPKEPRRAPAREAGAPSAPASAIAAPAPAAAPRTFEPRVPGVQLPAQPAKAAAVAPAVTVPTPTAVEPEIAATTPAKTEPEPQAEEPLQILQQIQPEVTRQITAANIAKGSVKVKYRVNTDGSVSDAEILSSSNRALNSSVLAALNRWKYAPLKQPRETQVEFAFDFSR
jgi:TonB family protein